jgi:hypothetical protein
VALGYWQACDTDCGLLPTVTPRYSVV